MTESAPDTKTCTNSSCEKRGEPQRLDAFRTKKLRNGTAAPTSWCRSCLNEASRLSMAAKADDPERVAARRARDAARYARIKADPALLDAERARKRVVAGRPKSAETIERQKAAQKKWRESPGGIAAISAWREANRDKMRAYATNYRARNLEDCRLRAMLGNYARRWRTYNQGAGIFTAQQAAICAAFWDNRCAYCSSPVRVKTSTSGRAGFDHVVPLSVGGSHGPENIVVCCKPCNDRKNNRILPERMLELAWEQLAAFVSELPDESWWSAQSAVPHAVRRAVFVAEEKLRGRGVTIGTDW